MHFRLFTFLLFTAFIVAALAKLPMRIAGVGIYFLDAVMIINFLYWAVNYKKLKEIVKKDKIAKSYTAFIIVLIISFVVSPITLDIGERLISFMYIIRVIAYFSSYFTFKIALSDKLSDRNKLFRNLAITGAILSIFGWLQYFLYPDLRNLSYLGWDPHYKRIFSSFLDPNYFGIILVIILITLMFAKNSLLVWPERLLIFITIIFTYSRSSYLSLIAVALYYCIYAKKYSLLVIAAVFFYVTIAILPRENLGAGVNLGRMFSLVQRTNNWREGLFIVSKYPLTGTGFNTLRFARDDILGLDAQELLISNSGAGLDNSLIFVAATAGIPGLIVFLYFLYGLFSNANIVTRISITAVMLHGMFQNTFFYPWVMALIWLIAAYGL